jgi:RNase H-fold protein (predicted Holliday junction resolvase)
MRCLGVDFGLKKTGFAFGDSESKITAPLNVVLARDLETSLARMVKSEGIELIVLGKPNNLTKPEQEEKRQAFLTFASTLSKVVEVDERYTTKESQAMQEEGNTADEDALAAQIILDAYFNEL